MGPLEANEAVVDLAVVVPRHALPGRKAQHLDAQIGALGDQLAAGDRVIAAAARVHCPIPSHFPPPQGAGRDFGLLLVSLATRFASDCGGRRREKTRRRSKRDSTLSPGHGELVPRSAAGSAARDCLVEGNSVRSTERMTGTHRDTICRLLVEIGEGCARLMDEEMRELPCLRIEVDEIWAYVGKKQRQLTPLDDSRRLGDQYTFVALDPESKLVPAYLVGKRDLPTAAAFIADLSDRLANRVQLSSERSRPTLRRQSGRLA
jgi:hypothetical protein